MSDFVTVAYGGPSGSLQAGDFIVLRGATAEWPRDLAADIVRRLPGHALTILDDGDEDGPDAAGAREPKRPRPSSTPDAAEAAVVTGSVASDSAHLTESDRSTSE